MEAIFTNTLAQFGAVGVICFLVIWLVRYLLCNNKKLGEGYKEITKQYSNHITENTIMINDLKNEFIGMKEILRDIRDYLKK